MAYLKSTDEDKGQSMTYSLVTNDDGLFVIIGNQLRKAKSANYESKKTHKITVKVVDSGRPAVSFDKF